MLKSGKSLTVFCLAVLAGCAGHLPQAERIASSVILDPKGMTSAQDAFYAAGEVGQLEAPWGPLVQQAQTRQLSRAGF